MGVVDVLLSLLDDVFQRYLSVKHTSQLVTHGKVVRVVLCKIIFHKDVISNSNFERPQSINRFYFSLISFVDLFISNQKQEFWKTSVRKKICNRNSRSVNFPCECEFSLRKTNTKYELLRTCFSRTLATDKITTD